MKYSLALIVATLAAPVSAIEYTVQTCADLADVDDTQATGLTIDSATFECEEYTRFRVRNTLVLKATGSAVAFSNFALKVLGELTVEPEVSFTGVVEQVKNGGVLSVAEGASVTFMSTADFSNNSVMIKQIGPISCGDGCTRIGRGLSYIVKKGGAIHNKGMLTFEDDALFVGNAVRTEDSVEQGRAGAISNTGSGSIIFKGTLVMEDSDVDGFFEGIGAAIYNRGDIVVDGESFFSGGSASDGGAIYQTPIGSMTFNSMANFTDNGAGELRGGAIFNQGVMDFTAGSLFDDNVASSSGDGGNGGAIYNDLGGVITLEGPTTFSNNNALNGGAIFNAVESEDDQETGRPSAITTFPDDTIFENNNANRICDDVSNGFNDDTCPPVED